MASSHCILRLCRLFVRPRPMRTRRHKVAIMLKNTKITWLCIILMRKNAQNTVFQVSGKISSMHKQLRPGILSAVSSSHCDHQVYTRLDLTAALQSQMGKEMVVWCRRHQSDSCPHIDFYLNHLVFNLHLHCDGLS